MDTCFLLNPVQLHGVLSNYYDPDSPISADLMAIITASSKVAPKSDLLQLDLDASPQFIEPKPHDVKMIEQFVPDYLSLPCLQAVMSMVNVEP